MKRLVVLIVLLVMGSQAVAETLVVFSGRKDKFVKPVIKQFTKETGIKVILHSGKSSHLINKLRLEGKNTKADLFLSNDAGALQVLTGLKLLSQLPDNIAGVIPANYRAADNSWIGLSARARVLVVNTRVKGLDFIKSVFDLGDKRLHGRLAITHNANGSFIAGVTVYQLMKGDDRVLKWLRAIEYNADGRLYNKHSKIVRDVANGKKAVGLVNHYYIYRHLDKHPNAPIRILIPDQGKDGMGVAWNVAGIGIVKYSKKQALAQKLVAYLASAKGQKIFSEVNREYPTRPGVAASKMVPAAGSYKVADVPMMKLGTMRHRTMDLLVKVGM